MARIDLKKAMQNFNPPQGNRGRMVVIVLMIALAVGVSYLLLKSKSEPQAQAAQQMNDGVKVKPALTVKLIMPSSQNLNATLSADGKIMAWQEAIVGAQVNGLQLIELKANVGDFVKKGQVLARFKTDIIAAELAQYNANVTEAQVNLAQAKADSARADSLKASGAISEQQISQYHTNHKAAQARLSAALATKHVGSTRLAQAVVIAPDDGVISSRTATVGSVAQAGQELFRIVLKNRLEWRAELTAEQIKQISSNMTAHVTLSDGEILEGVVRQVAPVLNEKTNSATVFVDIPNHGNARFGMFAKGTFDLAASDALTVPATAVVMRDGFYYVFKVNEQKQAQQVKVTIGRRDAEKLEITSGLADGHAIVESGADFLKDGDTVDVVP